MKPRSIFDTKVACIPKIIDIATMLRDLLHMWHKDRLDRQYINSKKLEFVAKDLAKREKQRIIDDKKN